MTVKFLLKEILQPIILIKNLKTIENKNSAWFYTNEVLTNVTSPHDNRLTKIANFFNAM